MHIFKFLWTKSLTFDVQIHSQKIYHAQTPKIPRAFTYEPAWKSSNHHIQMFAKLAKHLGKTLMIKWHVYVNWTQKDEIEWNYPWHLRSVHTNKWVHVDLSSVGSFELGWCQIILNVENYCCLQEQLCDLRLWHVPNGKMIGILWMMSPLPVR